MNLSALRSRANTLSGFDLTDAEVTQLLNEAQRDLARRSKYPRTTWSFDTVVGQTAYELPSDFLSPVSVMVNGRPLEGTDLDTAASIQFGAIVDYSDGLWFLDGETGYLNLTRTPGEVQPVSVRYVYRPVELVADDDVPSAFPEEFHPTLVLYLAEQYYATVEDNPELSQTNGDNYRASAVELERFRISQETGDGPFTIQIAGMTA